WINLTDDVKVHCELLLENDSHFWMPLESFVETFTDVDICHSSGQQSGHAELAQQCHGWYCSIYHGHWITGVSAGGCYNEETFHQNPAYLVPIHSDKTISKTKNEVPKVASDSKNATTPALSHTVLIGLLQKYRNSKRTSGLHDLKIGFHMFKLEQDDLNYIQEVIYDDDLELTSQCNKSNIEK